MIAILPKGGFDRSLGPIRSEENISIDGHPAVRTRRIFPDGTHHIIVSISDWFPYNRIELRTSKDNPEAQLEELNEIITTLRFLEVSN